MWSRWLSLVLLVAVTSACGDSPTSPTPVTQTDVIAGTGAEAVAGKLLTVHYTGWLYNPAQPEGKGAQFDSSVGATAFTFALGQGQVISGWDTGLVGMKVGGVRRLVIPPSSGYGGFRNGPIPPNAILLFEIELLDVQ
jgi:FKBP-type peptidyl-prolyl cis-trans isomerase FkpA